MGGVLARP